MDKYVNYRSKTSGENSLTGAQVKKLLSVVGRLDHEVLLRIAIECGLRRADVVAIEQANIDTEKGWLIFMEHKKDSLHKVPLPPALCRSIDQYIYTIGKQKWLFPTQHDGRGHLSSKTAWNILNKYLLVAKLPARPFHSLRATCIKLHQRGGWSIEQVMRLTNDTFKTISEHYTTPSEEDMREAAQTKPLFE